MQRQVNKLYDMINDLKKENGDNVYTMADLEKAQKDLKREQELKRQREEAEEKARREEIERREKEEFEARRRQEEQRQQEEQRRLQAQHAAALAAAQRPKRRKWYKL